MTPAYRIPQIGPLWMIVICVWLGLGLSIGDFVAGLLFDPSLHLRADEDWWNRLWNMGMLIAVLLWGDAIAASPRQWWRRLGLTLAWYAGGVWVASQVTTRTPLEVAIDVVGLLAVHRILIHLSPVPRYRWPTRRSAVQPDPSTGADRVASRAGSPQPSTTAPADDDKGSIPEEDSVAHRLGIIDLILLTTTIAILLSLKRVVPTAFEPMRTFWAAEVVAWLLIAAASRTAHMASLAKSFSQATSWTFIALALTGGFAIGLPNIEIRLSGNESMSWLDFAPNYAMWSGGFLTAMMTLAIATRVQSLVRGQE